MADGGSGRRRRGASAGVFPGRAVSHARARGARATLAAARRGHGRRGAPTMGMLKAMRRKGKASLRFRLSLRLSVSGAGDAAGRGGTLVVRVAKKVRRGAPGAGRGAARAGSGAARGAHAHGHAHPRVQAPTGRRTLRGAQCARIRARSSDLRRGGSRGVHRSGV